MPLSVFDMFKIGVGPSSSHTMGPMTAGARFRAALAAHLTERGDRAGPIRLRCRLHGALAWTGKGHATDRAALLGLCGITPETYDAEAAEAALARLRGEKAAPPVAELAARCDPAEDLIFDFDAAPPEHPNALTLTALREAGGPMDGEVLLETRYFSIGGGFVLDAAEMAARAAAADAPAEGPRTPYPYRSAEALLALAERHALSIADIGRANEAAYDRAPIEPRLDALQEAMFACIDRGLATEGVLPGGLNVKRRAPDLARRIAAEHNAPLPPHAATDWLLAYAMAVNEENAAGGRVVTAPTNGAAGVLPAVLKYYVDHCPGASREGARTFLLTAGVIGALIKTNASISGAEVGCQGEVGSAAAMAAAGLAAALGGTPAQVENAAEIALEHHLGMTCDPIAGLVQVPCIERNGLGAVKAVSAASLALRGDGRHLVSLDACVATMLATGRDMSDKYKETSRGGLAVNVPDC